MGALTLFVSLLFVGLVIIGLIILFTWWLKLRKVKKEAPSFDGTTEDWRMLNYDTQALERRKIIKDGKSERGARIPQKEVSGIGTDEAEISRIREQIRRKERELAYSRGD